MIRALRSHPQILAFGELFIREKIAFNNEGYRNGSERLKYLRKRYPTEFLDYYAFAPVREDIKAVGFNLFPDQIETVEYSGLWDWLERNLDLKIIFLHRENLLAAYTSLVLARNSGVFFLRDPSQRQNITAEIDPHECLAYFDRRERYRQEALKRIANHRFMEITYERFGAEPHSHLGTIQEFIGVEPRQLELDLVKQQVRPLWEVITNFAQLQAHFKGTRWSSFFDVQ